MRESVQIVVGHGAEMIGVGHQLEAGNVLVRSVPTHQVPWCLALVPATTVSPAQSDTVALSEKL